MDPDATPPAAVGPPATSEDDQRHGTPVERAVTAQGGVMRRRRSIRWLIEGLLIVVSVALGFSLTQWGDRRRERELADRMLLSVRTEVEYNRATLDPYLSIHRAWRDAFDRHDLSTGSGSAIDVLFETRPPLLPGMTTNVPLLRRAAWDTALSTGALRLIDYDLAAGISEIYNMQEYAASRFPVLFSDPAFFDPSARVAASRLAQTTMRELTFGEESLVALYDKHLPGIRAAAGGR